MNTLRFKVQAYRPPAGRWDTVASAGDQQIARRAAKQLAARDDVLTRVIESTEPYGVGRTLFEYAPGGRRAFP